AALSHRLGVAAAVGCHWPPLRELAQRNEVDATDHELDQPRALQQLCLAGPELFGGIEGQEDAGVAQRFGAGHLIELGEIYNIACTGESVGNDRLTPLAEFEGNDERWSAQLHAPPRLPRLGSRNCAEYVWLARSARKIGMPQWRPRTSLRQPSALGGRRRDRAGNARGRSLGSIPSLTWNAHETGWRRPSDGLTTTIRASPTGDARGWSGRRSSCASSSCNYACAAYLSDASIEPILPNRTG